MLSKKTIAFLAALLAPPVLHLAGTPADSALRAPLRTLSAQPVLGPLYSRYLSLFP